MNHNRKDLVLAKKVHVYINGDKFFTGRVFVVHPKTTRTLDAFLIQLTDSLKPVFGAVRHLKSADGAVEVKSLDDLVSGASYVGYGQKYQPYEYTEIKPLPLPPTHPNTNLISPREYTRRLLVSGRARKIVRQTVAINVYPNDDPYAIVKKVVLKPWIQKTWEAVLQEISSKVKIRTGAIRKVIDLNTREEVKFGADLQDNMFYVVCGGEKFKNFEYGVRPTILPPRHQMARRYPTLPPIDRTEKKSGAKSTSSAPGGTTAPKREVEAEKRQPLKAKAWERNEQDEEPGVRKSSRTPISSMDDKENDSSIMSPRSDNKPDSPNPMLSPERRASHLPSPIKEERELTRSPVNPTANSNDTEKDGDETSSKSKGNEAPARRRRVRRKNRQDNDKDEDEDKEDAEEEEEEDAEEEEAEDAEMEEAEEEDKDGRKDEEGADEAEKEHIGSESRNSNQPAAGKDDTRAESVSKDEEPAQEEKDDDGSEDKDTEAADAQPEGGDDHHAPDDGNQDAPSGEGDGDKDGMDEADGSGKNEDEEEKAEAEKEQEGEGEETHAADDAGSKHADDNGGDGDGDANDTNDEAAGNNNNEPNGAADNDGDSGLDESEVPEAEDQEAPEDQKADEEEKEPEKEHDAPEEKGAPADQEEDTPEEQEAPEEHEAPEEQEAPEEVDASEKPDVGGGEDEPEAGVLDGLI